MLQTLSVDLATEQNKEKDPSLSELLISNNAQWMDGECPKQDIRR